MRFKLWLEQNGGGRKELYHATLSGPNNEIVNSFIRNGINPSMAKGFKQGAGFYMFTNREVAVNHAKTLGENQGKGDSQGGTPGRLGCHPLRTHGFLDSCGEHLVDHFLVSGREWEVWYFLQEYVSKG